MMTEREVAELIFDEFRKTHSKSGQIVMMRNLRWKVG